MNLGGEKMKFNRPKVMVKSNDDFMEKVVSSNIDAIGYVPPRKELLVDFKGGSRYLFQDVAPEMFDEFKKAPSKGKFFVARIKAKFITVKIKSAPKKEEKVKETKDVK